MADTSFKPYVPDNDTRYELTFRAILFDRNGTIKSVAQKEFPQIFPRPGWVEHNPHDIWSSQAGVAAEAITNAGVSARDVAAIGITNQRETTIVWDRRTGAPICNAIVWQDRRTSKICDALKKKRLDRLIGRAVILFHGASA